MGVSVLLRLYETKMRTQQKLFVQTPEDPWGVKQHHSNIGAKYKNHQLNPGGPRNKPKSKLKF